MGSKTPTYHKMVVESTLSATAAVTEQILSELQANNFSQEDIFAVHLALEEAFLNAVKHGNKMDPEKKVRIEFAVDGDKVEMSMTDDGSGFEPGAVPDPRRGENLYRTEGRGLLLMRSYMDVVEFNERGNGVRMVRYREKPRLTKSGQQKESVQRGCGE